LRKISLEPIRVERFEPKDDEITATNTTVWSFPKRGAWATHKGDYRGNWPPQIPRVLIERYSKEGDIVLDPMAGSGTTCIEAVLLGRNCIAVDLTYHRLYWLVKAFEEQKAKSSLFGNDQRKLGSFKVFHGDARNLEKLQDESIDLILTHPPYLNIVGYNKGKIEGDLSGTRKLEEYLRM
jgi:DNA modification methylase